jgi:cyclase
MPCLLVRNGQLVKTIKFKNSAYVGDPINAVKIYNDKEVDEIIVLDVSATDEEKGPAFDLIASVASECFMPCTYGGGVRTLEHITKIFSLGIEKVVINTYAIENPLFIKEAASHFGSQSIVISIDAKRTMSGGYEVYTHGGKKSIRRDPVSVAQEIEKMGAGEILLTSIDQDGAMSGYDVDLIQRVAKVVKIPLIACGGAGCIEDLADAVKKGGASAVAVGSLAVFMGKNRAVLINFPVPEELKKAFSS